MMQPLGRKILYFVVLLIIPILLWIIAAPKIHYITFLLMFIFFLISRHWNVLRIFSETFEIILLFTVLNYLLSELGIDKFFPANNVIVIILLFVFLLIFKKSGRQKLFLLRGKTTGVLAISFLFAALSVASLAVWFLFQEQNPHAKFIPNVPLFFLIPLGIGFSILNAIYEEGIFRSILLSQFFDQLGFAWAIVLQAAWFSFLHFQSGFPSGIIGIGLTFVFGVMMGYLVFRTSGLLIPVLIHAVADFSIFILILLRMKEFI
ncbi:MAG TPA: type II CAAX endopeptidase family protein [bacterium]